MRNRKKQEMKKQLQYFLVYWCFWFASKVAVIPKKRQEFLKATKH